MSPRLALGLTLALAGVGAACGDSRLSDGASDGAVAGDDGDAKTDVAPDGGVGDVADAGEAAGKRSAGCGASPDQVLGKYVEHMQVVSDVAPAYAATYTDRKYWLRLPLAYDPARAYPTVLIGPGCGESGQAPIPIQQASGEDAIIVGLNGVNDCFTHDTADTPDLPYFDATLATVEASSCVDTSRVFVMGFSSGSWLTSFLGCARGDVIRAQASVAGGLPPIPPTCKGPIPAMFVTDTADTSPSNVMAALARVLATNGCGTTTVAYDIGVPSPCVQYQGCMAGEPVIFCETMGLGHVDQSTTKISTVGFWHFFTSLP